MMFCKTCEKHTEHEYRPRDGVQDAYCKVCETRNWVVCPQKAGQAIVINAIDGSLHC